ncbi:MAG: ROK family protein [Firmicutes bacterium]|nr:ROK family protein [Bacillota bacterium]
MNTLQSVLGIDIGGTNVRLAHVDRELRVIRSRKEKVEDVRADLVTFLLATIEDFVSTAEIPIGAVAIGIPGIISSAGKILSMPNLDQGLVGLNLKEAVQARFGIPTFVHKDVNFILYGEYRTQRTTPEDSVIGFYIGTGVGCATVIQGRLLTGERGFAGELGHTPLRGKDDPCNCGNSGCFELYASGRTLVDITSRAGTNIEEVFVNPQHSAEVDEWLANLTLGLAGAITLIDPKIVIIGGGVADMQGFPLARLEEKLRGRSRHPLVAEDLIIKRSTAGPLGGCLGAAMYCFDNVENN